MRGYEQLFDRMGTVIESPGNRVNGPGAPTLGVDMYEPIRTHVLYRFFNADNELLYVGITSQLGVRFKEHQNGKPWFTEISHSTIEHFESRPGLVAAELKAIKAERPKYNIVGNNQNPPKPSRPALMHPSARQERRGGTRLRSITGSDANYFRAPDAICDEDEDVRQQPEPLPRWRLPLGCPVCFSMAFYRVHIPDFNGKVDDRVVCEDCHRQTTYEEWHGSNLRFPKAGGAA